MIRRRRFFKETEVLCLWGHYKSFLRADVSLKILILLFHALLFSESKIPDIPKAKKFGCFAKTTDRGLEALNSLESDKCFLIDDDGSLTREDAFEKCAWLAFKRGYRVFGLDGNNTCSSGHLLWRFYKGGFEADCKGKAGGYGSNIVYYFKGNIFLIP